LKDEKSEKKSKKKILEGGKFFQEKFWREKKIERERFTKSIENNLKRKTFTSKIKKLR